MNQRSWLIYLLGLFLPWMPVDAQVANSSSTPPRLEAVAETKLLMEGLAQSNYRGLERLLRDRPAEEDTWVFARGQALLIAETGNLLLLRPPKNQGEGAWMKYGQELRIAGLQLARQIQSKDWERSRQGMLVLANVCNRCHQTFRIPVRVGPAVADPPPRAEPNGGLRDTE